MDFIKLLRSLEELLFEALSWLVFYPKTVWRMLTAPMATMDYSDLEQVENVEDAYSDTLSPGFFLIITLLLLHGVELALGIEVTMDGAIGQMASANDQNLLVTRALLFGLFPLVYSVLLLVGKGEVIDRDKLRAPFFAQCYLVGLGALLFGLSVFLARSPVMLISIIGVFAALFSIFYFIGLEALWLRREGGIALWRAIAMALGGCAVVFSIMAVVANVLLLG